MLHHPTKINSSQCFRRTLQEATRQYTKRHYPLLLKVHNEENRNENEFPYAPNGKMNRDVLLA